MIDAEVQGNIYGRTGMDIVGRVFGTFTVMSKAPSRKSKTYWVCLCSCGEERHLRGDRLVALQYKCRCSRGSKNVISTHGMSSHPAYASWCDMKQRCTNPNRQHSEHYFGRGITYCEEWEQFDLFWRDMGDEWDEGTTLDRMNVDGGYYKENCRWVNKSVQQHNKRKLGGTRSAFKGVYPLASGEWYAEIKYKGVKHNQSPFSTEIAAACSYDDMSEVLYGDRPNNTKKELTRDC